MHTERFTFEGSQGDALAARLDVPSGRPAATALFAELLLAALGSCTSMTIRMYADRKEWPLQGVEVRLTYRRVHGDDCRDCEVRPAMVDEIERVLDLVGPLTADQRGRLLEMAERCALHRTLVGTKRIVTRLAVEGGGIGQ